MSIVVELTAVGHHVVVLQAERCPALGFGRALDINGTLLIFFTFVLPVIRSMSTLNNSVLGKGLFLKYRLPLHHSSNPTLPIQPV